MGKYKDIYLHIYSRLVKTLNEISTKSYLLLAIKWKFLQRNETKYKSGKLNGKFGDITLQ